MALKLERPQPEQQLKPAMNPLLQGIFNLKGGGLKGVLPNDPVIENLIKAGEFLKTQANDPLTYLGGGTVKGGSLATSFLIARTNKIKELRKLTDLLSNETDPREIAALQRQMTKVTKDIKKIDADNVPSKKPKTFDEIGTKPPSYQEIVERETKRISDELFGKIKQGTLELADATKKTGRKPMSVDEIATQIRRNEEAGTPFMFRGERGIASLPNKPKYLAADALDSRLPEFSKKGFEIYQPQFNKVLDVDNMPSRVDEILTNIEMRGGRPSRTGGANQRDFDIERIRGNIRDSANKTPSSIDKGTTKIFQDEGYDALRFPPRRFKGESDTYISLDPANNLKLFENVSPDMIDDLIRELARNQMK